MKRMLFAVLFAVVSLGGCGNTPNTPNGKSVTDDGVRYANAQAAAEDEAIVVAEAPAPLSEVPGQIQSLLKAPAPVKAADTVKPVAKLAGPSQSPVGELCIFSAEGSAGSLAWRCLPSKPMLIGDGRRSAGFASNVPGTYYVVLVATAGDSSDIAVISLMVGSPPLPGPLPPGPVPPGPPPSPGPAPVPVPVPNDALAQLTALACQTAKQIPVEGRNEVAAALAEIYTAYADAISKGKFTKIADVRAAIRADANTRIGYKNAVVWGDWGTKVGEGLRSFVEVGGQADLGRYKQALEALAAGLTQSAR